MVERIIFDGVLHGLVIRRATGLLVGPGTEFFTPKDEQLQVGRIRRLAGDRIAPHEHRRKSSVIAHTAEVLVVLSGRARVTFWHGEDFSVRDVQAGDVVVIYQGGHGLEFTEDTELLEVKQGPWQDDKVLIQTPKAE